METPTTLTPQAISEILAVLRKLEYSSGEDAPIKRYPSQQEVDRAIALLTD